MIYIKNDCKNPYYNLAFEEYVFRTLCKEEPVLLLWQNEPSVIVGRYQNTIEEINSDFVDKQKIHVVRRITGGGAVYHDLGNLNYSFLIPKVRRDIDFKSFATPLLETLGKVGVKAELTGRNDITVEGRKFSGNAQCYQGDVLLHHGTILYDVDIENMQKALAVKPGKIISKGIKSVRSRVTNIKPYLHRSMDIDEFKAFLLRSFSNNVHLSTYEMCEEDLKEVCSLVNEKYKLHEWNYGSAFPCDIIRKGYFPGGYLEIRMQIENGAIKDMKVYGDFFSLRNIEEFEEMFRCIEYSREEVRTVLNSIAIEEFFNGFSARQIENIIL